jgi:hypothetical protein
VNSNMQSDLRNSFKWRNCWSQDCWSFDLRRYVNDALMLEATRFHFLRQNQQLQSKDKTMRYKLNTAFVDLHWRTPNPRTESQIKNIKSIEIFSRRWRPG